MKAKLRNILIDKWVGHFGCGIADCDGCLIEADFEVQWVVDFIDRYFEPKSKKKDGMNKIPHTHDIKQLIDVLTAKGNEEMFTTKDVIKMLSKIWGETSGASCVQCHRPLTHCVDDDNLQGKVFVCHYPDCPNYGLLTICQENMPDAT